MYSWSFISVSLESTHEKARRMDFCASLRLGVVVIALMIMIRKVSSFVDNLKTYPYYYAAFREKEMMDRSGEIRGKIYARYGEA